MKRWVLAFVFSLCPVLALAEQLESVHVGTPDNPTIDGGWMNPPSTSEKSTNTKKPKLKKSEEKISDEKALKNNSTPTKPGVSAGSSSTQWDEKHVDSVLQSAAKGGKLSYVLNAAKKHQLPASVALIPIIESRYQMKAVSPKGAAGIWQLSNALASDFSLPSSERFNFSASTEVALTHLARLHAHYGRWDYAWAAYNAGQGRVDKALLKNPQASDVNELSLPNETKDYVNQMHALHSTLSQMVVHA